MLPRIIYLTVFLSGFTSLAYELCWIRKGALLIGASPQALSCVVAVFFGGLAAGAYLFGGFSKKTNRALLWYGIFECSIGVLAAATPFLFAVAADVYSVAYQSVGSNQLLHILARSSVVALLIFPPCFLMGGTLPLLCQFFVTNRYATIRYAAGILYAINTAGAFTGCMLSGMWLIPYQGISTTIWLNALLSLMAGGVCIFVHCFRRPPEPFPAVSTGDTPSDPSPASPGLSGYAIYGLFWCAGFTALGYEILWVRFLSLLIHNTVYTCIFTIGAILLGIAIGGVIVCFLRDRPRLDVLLFAGLNIFIGFVVILLILQPLDTWEWIRDSRSVSMQAVLCLTLILIPSIASGVTFPLAYRLVAAYPHNSGRDLGRLTAVNTLGGIAGSLLVGFYLLPAQGMYTTLITLTLISLTIGIVTIFVFADGITPLQRWLSAGGTATLFLGIICFSSTNLPADFLAGRRTMIEFTEGISSFISVVIKDGDKTLEMDRMWQGEYQKGHQILAAHIPMMLHRDPANVLVIGMGTGQVASRFLMYDIQHLDCVEIEKKLPAMLKRHFDSRWLDDPRATVVTDDGRSFTAHSSKKYDVISIEVGQSFRPQVASFYTVDFYRDVKRRLADSGLACQFVPLGFFTEDEFRSVVRSFLEVFPHSTLWFNKYAECILIGSPTQQPRLSEQRLMLLQNDKRLRSDLKYSLDNKPWLLLNRKDVFAANYLMGPEKLARLSASAPLYRDERPILEYQTARTTYSLTRLHDLIEKNMDSPDTIFAGKIPVSSEAKIIQIREETVHESLRGGK
ncbi:MAG TPA: fused MFS/spermidine synthase [Desulfuromonadales bacterium]|nr:fused MFS/spermidine synthase [Desulfuromonadales bacterium]